MPEPAVCDLPGCGDEGAIVSRLFAPKVILLQLEKKPIRLEKHTVASTTVKIIMMS